jgi:hypothetical protein
MVTKRVVAGAVIAAVLVLGGPASAKGRISFVVTGGDLKHAVSFDGTLLNSNDWWWRPASTVPSLPGWRYRLRIYDSSTLASDWIYIPGASGALPTGPLAQRGRADDGKPVAWMEFNASFNSALIHQIRVSQESSSVFALAAIGLLLLLMMTALGPRFARVTRPFFHWLVTSHVRVFPDPGPVFLYTSVPRGLWMTHGRLGSVPNSRR